MPIAKNLVPVRGDGKGENVLAHAAAAGDAVETGLPEREQSHILPALGVGQSDPVLELRGRRAGEGEPDIAEFIAVMAPGVHADHAVEKGIGQHIRE